MSYNWNIRFHIIWAVSVTTNSLASSFEIMLTNWKGGFCDFDIALILVVFNRISNSNNIFWLIFTILIFFQNHLKNEYLADSLSFLGKRLSNLWELQRKAMPRKWMPSLWILLYRFWVPIKSVWSCWIIWSILRVNCTFIPSKNRHAIFHYSKCLIKNSSPSGEAYNQ